MKKLTLIPLVFLSFSFVYAQQNILIFKKGRHTIEQFWIGSTFAFQLQDEQWQKGTVTKIQSDSFYIQPTIVQYSLFGTDTFHYAPVGYSLADVYALPKRGLLIHYVNGHFEINKSAGNMHFYWIKSGWLFRTGAEGYAGLHVVNGIIRNDLSFSESKTTLGLATAVFFGGVLLHKLYKVTYTTGRKYHLQMLKLSD